MTRIQKYFIKKAFSHSFSFLTDPMSDGAELPRRCPVEYRMEENHDGGDGVECDEGSDGGEPPRSGGVDEGEGDQRLAHAVVQNLEHQHGNVEPAQGVLFTQIP